MNRAIHYLEKAGELARQSGAYEEAQRYLNESLAIDATASVLSSATCSLRIRPSPIDAISAVSIIGRAFAVSDCLIRL